MTILLIIIILVQLATLGLFLYLLNIIERHHSALVGIVKHLKKKEKRND